MLKQLFCLLLFFTNYLLVAQSGILITTYETQNQSECIVGHSDSSLFVLRIKEYEKGKFDFYLSKHPAFKNKIAFDTCLHIAKIFGGKFDAKTFKHTVFQCKEHIVFIFDVYIGTHKKVIAKAVNFNGNVSDAFVLEDCDLSNAQLMECNYTYDITDKKEILITLRRKYKSGFQRDKCILYNEYMSRLWEYELPKINYHYEVNVLTTVYNSNQLIYRVANGFLDKSGNEWIIKNDYDTVIKKTIDGLLYDLKVPKDSLCLFIVNPVKNTAIQTRVYWPFKKQARIVPISSSQIILYDLVDIDDEKYALPGKKAMYYKRIDIKNNTILFEDLIPFDRHIQENLTYACGPGSNGPTSKIFALDLEKIIDGKLVSLYENTCFEECEIIVSSFNIVANNFEWMHLFPRKISTSSELKAITCSYASQRLQIGFYENTNNFNVPIELYRHNKHKMVRSYNDSQFITWSINNSNKPVKSIVDTDTEYFLFPWLGNNEDLSGHFFISENFLPIRFLYRMR